MQSVNSHSTATASAMSTRERSGGWIPSDPKILGYWLHKFAAKVDFTAELLPVVKELKYLIESDAELSMNFTEMLASPNYSKNKVGNTLDGALALLQSAIQRIGAVKNSPQTVDEMLSMINSAIQRPPDFDETALVACPINAILAHAMTTYEGSSVFLDERVNAQLKNILNYWGKYLVCRESTSVLNTAPNGWFSPEALAAMKKAYGGDKEFDEVFLCDHTKDHYGFISWDNFFTRLFRFDEGIRPVAFPNDDTVIANACESTPYNVQRDVQLQDTFWLKSQRYSLEFMLNHDELAPRFVGGTVYQAFLSALSYHRWHSPVDGTIVKIVILDGSYYAEAMSEGGQRDVSQGYITQFAARALIFIEANNPDIGLVCFISVGMVEVSSNQVTVGVGQHVKKGEQLGMFHFGGSSHCLIFGPSVKLQFINKIQQLVQGNIPVRSKIADVVVN